MNGEAFATEVGPMSYAQGQPMGAYSSWPMMALTHHFIVRYASYLIGLKSPRYAILGDDALIVGDDLFASYKKVCDSLLMEVNVSKTFRSRKLFEFAKRFFYKNEEISAFPLGAILASQCDISRFSVTMDNAIAKS